MTEPRKHRCETCAAFSPTPEVAKAWGECRRRSTPWPGRSKSDWCLEYVPDEATTKEIIAAAEKRLADAYTLATRAPGTPQ